MLARRASFEVASRDTPQGFNVIAQGCGASSRTLGRTRLIAQMQTRRFVRCRLGHSLTVVARMVAALLDRLFPVAELLLEVVEIERDWQREGVLLEGVAFAIGVIGADLAEFIFESA